MRPRAIYTFGSIVTVLLGMFFATAVADCLISAQSGTVAKLLALKAPERVYNVAIHLNTKVSNLRFTVVTVYALLTRDLFATAKCLVCYCVQCIQYVHR